MKINFKRITFYYLTTGNNPEKEKHLNKIFKDYNLIQVSVKDYLDKGKQQSACIGINRIIDLGLRNQKINEGFKPFVIIEDDVSIYDNIPNFLDIPDDSDFLYIGISRKGLVVNKNCGLRNNIYADDINENIVRIYNMLGTHAIMICSAAGGAAYQRSNMENYFKTQAWDLYLAKLQPHYKFYALRKPIFYQDKKYGGYEELTKYVLNRYSKNNGSIFLKKKTISNLMAFSN